MNKTSFCDLLFLMFGVCKESMSSEEDGITFELVEENGKTTLHILQGDFSPMTDGKIYRDASAEIWDKVLPKIKELADN